MRTNETTISLPDIYAGRHEDLRNDRVEFVAGTNEDLFVHVFEDPEDAIAVVSPESAKELLAFLLEHYAE